MDGSNFAPRRAAPLVFPPQGPGHLPGHLPGPLPEREWSLTAGQVVGVVLLIVAACELIGLLS